MVEADMRLCCECDSYTCNKAVEIPLVEATLIQRQKLVVIASDCVIGPSATDRLVEERDGYNLYREA
jgi:hypothetical protein